MPCQPPVSARLRARAHRRGVRTQGVYVCYQLSTDAPIASVVAFYRSEAARAGVALFDDTGAKFADYRNLTFIAQPKFLNVVIDRQEQRTNVFVSYKIGNTSTCSAR